MNARRLTAVLSGLLVGLGLRSLADVLKTEKPSRGKAILIALLVIVISTAIGCLLWALDFI